MPQKKEPSKQVVEVPSLEIKELTVRIVGDSTLVLHKWSEKAKEQIRRTQAKEAKVGREKRDPKAECEAALYRDAEGHPAFRSIAFKQCMVRGGKGCSMVMTDLRTSFHVVGELTKIFGDWKMREDMVTVGKGSADLRYRPEFPKWHADLVIQYDASVVSPAQLVTILNKGGFGTGVGEGRPEKDGAWGRFHVEGNGESR